MTGHTEGLSCPQTKVEIRSLIKLWALGCSRQIHSYAGRGMVLCHLIARVPVTWHNRSFTNVPCSSRLFLVTLTCPWGCGIKARWKPEISPWGEMTRWEFWHLFLGAGVEDEAVGGLAPTGAPREPKGIFLQPPRVVGTPPGAAFSHCHLRVHSCVSLGPLEAPREILYIRIELGKILK